jgi:Leucine-rich repeat (LRR) protein
MKRSTGDIADEFMFEHLQNKHRHSASVTNLNTLNMGVKSSTESFTNQAFVSASTRSSKIS